MDQSKLFRPEFYNSLKKTILSEIKDGFFPYDFFASTGQVEIPNTLYNGQELTKEVKTNIPPKTNNTIPKVPVTVPVK
jgi:uncharacterized protein YdeI (BOF family)